MARRLVNDMRNDEVWSKGVAVKIRKEGISERYEVKESALWNARRKRNKGDSKLFRVGMVVTIFSNLLNTLVN